MCSLSLPLNPVHLYRCSKMPKQRMSPSLLMTASFSIRKPLTTTLLSIITWSDSSREDISLKRSILLTATELITLRSRQAIPLTIMRRSSIREPWMRSSLILIPASSKCFQARRISKMLPPIRGKRIMPRPEPRTFSLLIIRTEQRSMHGFVRMTPLPAVS